MKVAVIGTHGTGKSTLSYHLAALLKKANPTNSVICLEENVRKIAKLTDNRLNTLLFQKLAISDQLFRELSHQSIYDIIITDRTLIDYLIYGMINGVILPEYYLDLAIDHLIGFEEIYFLRPDFKNSPIENDGFRDIDMNYRNQIDQEFERNLKYFSIDYKELKTSEILTYDYLKDLQ